MHLLGCLVTLLLSGILLVAAFGLSLLNLLFRFFGIRRPRTFFDSTEQKSARPESQPKRFADDEGEYVDFEEV